MNDKELIEQFKREIKSINYYDAKIQECREQLTCIHTLMYEAKTINYGEKMGHGTYNLIELIYKEEQLCREQQAYEIMRESILRKLARASLHDRELLIDIYIKKHSYEKKARMEYMSEIQLKRSVNRIILELEKDDTQYIKK